MAKWADYVVIQASFNSKRRIATMKKCEDTGQGLGMEEIVTRDQVIHDISKGKSYITGFSTKTGVKKGQKIHVREYENEFYLRIDKNKAPFDFLGPIAEVS